MPDTVAQLGKFAPFVPRLRNAMLARRGAQILEETAQLSSKRGSLEEQQQQKVLEAPALSIWICAARCHKVLFSVESW